MGREVRKVPADWQHPRNDRGRYIPLSDRYEEDLREWKEGYEKWNIGLVWDFGKKVWIPKSDNTWHQGEYWEYAGDPPHEEDYMLVGVPEEERTHLMMYEDTSEGTPISPAFETPEQLARWLADTGASAFGGAGATYEAWLTTCKGGWAPSAAWSRNTGLISGVEAMNLD